MQAMWYNSNVKVRSLMEDMNGKSSEPSGTYYHEDSESSSVPFMVCH